MFHLVILLYVHLQGIGSFETLVSRWICSTARTENKSQQASQAHCLPSHRERYFFVTPGQVSERNVFFFLLHLELPPTRLVVWSVQAGIRVVSLFDSKVSNITDIIDCCNKDLFLPKNDFQGRLKACQEELLMELHNHIDQVLCLWVASFVPHTLLKNESI